MTAGHRILVVASVEAERDAILRGIGQSEQFQVEAVGVGSAQAAAGTAALLARSAYQYVINAGIAGGFQGQADIGSLVVASEIVAADFGAETGEGFRFIDDLGFGSARIAADKEAAERLAASLREYGLPVVLAPIVTVTTVTGSADTASELGRRVPGAAAEAMEGFGAGTAAALFRTPFLELRAISNKVGPRDRAAWRIPDALISLEAAGRVLTEVF